MKIKKNSTGFTLNNLLYIYVNMKKKDFCLLKME